MMGHHCILIQRSHRGGRRPKRMDSASDRLLQTIFSGQAALSDVEVEYLAAAEAGDLSTVERAINDYNVNINCYDHFGRCALELAVMYDHLAVIEYLLPRSNLQCIEDALLYAIEKDKVKISEAILDVPLYRNPRVQLTNADGFYHTADNDSPRMRPHTTPLVLAAQKNNFYIVQLLIARGATIAPPHDYFCDCTECGNMRVYDSVKYSRSRLNTYKALASPAYISLSSDDPILQAFLLSHQLEHLADIEKEYKSEYRLLSNRCKDYGVELLDLCRTTEEIVSILNEDGSEEVPEVGSHSLARVRLALKYEQKRFIAHATCQRQLISLWYSGLPWMRHQRVAVKLLAVPLATLLLPVCSMIFLVAPKSSFGKIMKSPFVKFLNHTCAYIVFLMFIFMATTRGGSGTPMLDLACKGISGSLPDSVVYTLILVWVLGMFMHECRQLYREGPVDYITDWWNWMDSSLIFLYLAYYGIGIVVLVKVSQASLEQRDYLCPKISEMSCREMRCIVDQSMRNLTTCSAVPGSCAYIDDLYTPPDRGEVLGMMSDMTQLADIFFALASVLSFARIAHLLPANEQLGPLLVSFGRMLHDVVRFGAVFILVFLAFMCGLTNLYRVHECENNHFSRLDLTLSSLFWATFGMGDTKATQLDHRYLGVEKDLITTHTTHHPLTVIVGYILFWVYISASVVVLLNMIIAMMSNSFQEIYDDRDVEWKFARAKLWIDFFEEGCTLPTPFNLVPSPKYLYRFGVWIRKKVKKTMDEPPVQMAYIYTRRKNGLTEEDIASVQLPKKPDSLYKIVTNRLVKRYIYKKESEKMDVIQAESEMTDIKSEIGTLCTDVSKLRHEMAFVNNSISHGYVKQKNGVINRSSTIHPKSKIELQV